jgi:hypothetical protein
MEIAALPRARGPGLVDANGALPQGPCMAPNDLLDAIDHRAPLTNVTVFPFNRLRTVLNLVLYAGLTVALLVAGLLLGGHLNLDAGAVAYGAIAVWGLFLLLSLWRAAEKGRDLLHARSNVLAIAPFGVVRRLRGVVKVWPFVEHPELTVVSQNRSIESIYLNRPGHTFDELLVDDGTFGPMPAIAQALNADRPRAPTS